MTQDSSLKKLRQVPCVIKSQFSTFNLDLSENRFLQVS